MGRFQSLIPRTQLVIIFGMFPPYLAHFPPYRLAPDSTNSRVRLVTTWERMSRVLTSKSMIVAFFFGGSAKKNQNHASSKYNTSPTSQNTSEGVTYKGNVCVLCTLHSGLKDHEIDA